MGVNLIAAFLARNGRRGFGEVLVPVDDDDAAAGLAFCASPSGTLTLDDSACVWFLEGSAGGGKSTEMDVSGPPELRGGVNDEGGVKDDGRVCGR